MSELRALMLARSKQPAKIQVLDEIEGASSHGDAKSGIRLPRMDQRGGTQPNPLKSLGRRTQESPGRAPSRIPGRPPRNPSKPRPFSEPMLTQKPSTPSMMGSKGGSGTSKISKGSGRRSDQKGASSSTASVSRRNLPDDDKPPRMPSKSSHDQRTERYAERCEQRERQRQERDFEESSAAVKNKNFGKVPSYINKRRSEKEEKIRRENEEKDRVITPDGFRQVSESEKDDTLITLYAQKRDTEEEMNRRAPFRSETMGQKKIEKELNDDLKRIEEGIRVYSKEIIFVPKDTPPMAPYEPRKKTRDDADAEFANWEMQNLRRPDQTDLLKHDTNRNVVPSRTSNTNYASNHHSQGGSWFADDAPIQNNNRHREKSHERNNMKLNMRDVNKTDTSYSSRQPPSPNRRREQRDESPRDNNNRSHHASPKHYDRQDTSDYRDDHQRPYDSPEPERRDDDRRTSNQSRERNRPYDDRDSDRRYDNRRTSNQSRERNRQYDDRERDRPYESPYRNDRNNDNYNPKQSSRSRFQWENNPQPDREDDQSWSGKPPQKAMSDEMSTRSSIHRGQEDRRKDLGIEVRRAQQPPGGKSSLALQ